MSSGGGQQWLSRRAQGSCSVLTGLVARSLGNPSRSGSDLEPAVAAGGGHSQPCVQSGMASLAASSCWLLCWCPVALQGRAAADPGARPLVHDRQVPDADEGTLHRRPLRLRHRLQVPALRGGSRARELHQQGECSLGSCSASQGL